MNKVQQRRFERLIACTKHIDPDNFDMGMFAYDCGTPACVIGHYAANRKIQRTFRLEDNLILLEDGDVLDFLWWNNSRALEDHFGITEVDVDHLFSAKGCGGAKTPKGAASYLKKFYASKLKEDK